MKCPIQVSNKNVSNNGVQKKWSTQNNTCEMTCYYQSQPGVRTYRQWFHAFWKGKGVFQVEEQRLCDQVPMMPTTAIREDKKIWGKWWK